MKYFVKFFVVTFFLFVCTNSFAEQKIVVLDLKFVLNESKAGAEAQDFLQKSFNDNVKKFTEMENSLKKEEQDLLAKKTTLSEAEYTQKTNDLRNKVKDYQTQRRESLDKIATQRAKARERLIEKLNTILDTHIQENKISLVINKKDLLAGKNEFNITNVIVEKLNKELPSLNLK